MFSPDVAARIEQRSILPGVRINGRLACAFAKRTGNTGQRQIISQCLTSCDNRHDMIKMKCGFLSGL